MKSTPVRLCILLLLALHLTSCGVSLVAPSYGIESLDRFPQDSVIIRAHDRSYPFTVWVADTAARRSQGLMQVSQLDADRGMLFLFDHPTRPGVWMKNMEIPVDLLFISPQGKILTVARNVTPDSLWALRSDEMVTGFMELPGGTAARLRLETGDQIRHPHFIREADKTLTSLTNNGAYRAAGN